MASVAPEVAVEGTVVEGTVAAPGGDAVVAGTVVSMKRRHGRRRGPCSFRCPRASNTSARRKWDRTTGSTSARVQSRRRMQWADCAGGESADAPTLKRRVHVCNGNPGTLTVEDSVCVKGLCVLPFGPAFFPICMFPCLVWGVWSGHKDMDWPPWAEHALILTRTSAAERCGPKQMIHGHVGSDAPEEDGPATPHVRVSSCPAVRRRRRSTAHRDAHQTVVRSTSGLLQEPRCLATSARFRGGAVAATAAAAMDLGGCTLMAVQKRQNRRQEKSITLVQPTPSTT